MSLERDCEALVGFQGSQRACCGRDPVTALGVLHRTRSFAQQASDDVVGLVPPCRQQTLSGAPHRERLTARDDLHPGDEHRRGPVGRFRQQDLHRPLEGILGVVGAQRHAPRRPPEIGLGNRE